MPNTEVYFGESWTETTGLQRLNPSEFDTHLPFGSELNLHICLEIWPTIRNPLLWREEVSAFLWARSFLTTSCLWPYLSDVRPDIFLLLLQQLNFAIMKLSHASRDKWNSENEYSYSLSLSLSHPPPFNVLGLSYFNALLSCYTLPVIRAILWRTFHVFVSGIHGFGSKQVQPSLARNVFSKVDVELRFSCNLRFRLAMCYFYRGYIWKSDSEE